MTLTTTEKAERIDSVPENWHKKSESEVDFFDLIVDAYESGKRDGFQEYVNIVKEKFQSNITSAAENAEFVFSKLKKEYQVKSIELYLKADSPTKFEALYIVPKKDFASDDFLRVYNLCRTLKAEINDSTFHLSFTFMPNSRHLNRHLIVCDGFSLKYEFK